MDTQKQPMPPATFTTTHGTFAYVRSEWCPYTEAWEYVVTYGGSMANGANAGAVCRLIQWAEQDLYGVRMSGNDLDMGIALQRGADGQFRQVHANCIWCGNVNGKNIYHVEVTPM